jgi:hypothetical protein
MLVTPGMDFRGPHLADLAWSFVSQLATLACGVGCQVERYRLGGWVGGCQGGVTAGIPLNKK